jgi:hypothetical protein
MWKRMESRSSNHRTDVGRKRRDTSSLKGRRREQEWKEIRR